MDNIFDKMMKKGSSSEASKVGRPMHNHWDGYKKVYINGKLHAKCFNCLNVQPNTAKVRLESHR